MNELQKVEAGNYATMAGFMIMGILGLLVLFDTMSSGLAYSVDSMLILIAGILLLLVGVFLAAAGNRGLSAIFFLCMGAFSLISSFAFEETFLLQGIAFGVLTLMLLFGKDGKRGLYALLSLIFCLNAFFAFFGLPLLIGQILSIIQIVLVFWFAIACMAERVGFPGHSFITAREALDFKASGSTLGYLLIALICGVWAAYYLLSENVVALASIQLLKFIVAIMLILLAILLFAIGKMRYTPMVFMIFGFIMFATALVSGIAMFALGGVLIVLGIITFFRKDSRVLLGLLLILYGLTFFVSVLITGNYSLGVFNAIINIIPGVIALYLAFAVFAQNKKCLV